jgi:hypothetical protein
LIESRFTNPPGIDCGTYYKCGLSLPLNKNNIAGEPIPQGLKPVSPDLLNVGAKAPTPEAPKIKWLLFGGSGFDDFANDFLGAGNVVGLDIKPGVSSLLVQVQAAMDTVFVESGDQKIANFRGFT